MSGSSDGFISYWDTISGKSLGAINTRNDSDIHSLDISKSGETIAIGGKDCNVKVYDYGTRTLMTTLKAINSASLGHCNRIYSIKFTDDPNILISGGWDNTIYIWDLKSGKSIAHIFGIHICGDSIDLKKDQMLVGTFDKENVLQIWSIANRKIIQNIEWYSEPHDDSSGYLYSARFEKGERSKYIIATGRIGYLVFQVKYVKHIFLQASLRGRSHTHPHTDTYELRRKQQRPKVP